jgi:hypothetical protein
VNGKKSATPGSAGSATAVVVDSTMPSLSDPPKPVVRSIPDVDSVQRMRGKNSIEPCFNRVLVPFWFPASPRT